MGKIIKPKAIIYTRVSSKEQETNGFSIPAQTKCLKEYAENKNFEIIQEFSESTSAKESGRFEFERMLKFLKKNKTVKNLLVEKNDRLLRNETDFAKIVQLAKSTDINIHLVKDNAILNKSSMPDDFFMFTIQSAMSARYSRNLSNEVKKGMREKAEQGYWPNKPPYGYTKKYNDKNNLIIEKKEAEYVKTAYELYATGNHSLQSVINELYNRGIFYKPHRPKAEKNQLYKLLKNPLYKGLFLYDGVMYQGKQPPIVSNALYDAVQKSFERENKPKVASVNLLYGGLMHCGDCGCTIVGEIKKNKYIYYHCNFGKGKDKCSQSTLKWVKQKEIDQQILGAIKNIQITPEHKEWIIKAIKHINEKQTNISSDKLKTFQAEIEKNKNRLQEIYLDKLEGKITEEFWLSMQNQITEKIEKYKGLINAYDRAELKTMNEVTSTLELSETAYNKYLEGNDEVKRKIVNSLLSNLTLRDGKLSYTYKKPFDILAKGLCCSKWWAAVDSNHRPHAYQACALTT